MTTVFLSHSSLDKPFVRLFGEDLAAAGVEVWLDEVQLRIGDSIPLAVSEAIDASDFFIVFLSRHSLTSSWVRKELAIAATKEINGCHVSVLPIRLDSSPVQPLVLDKLYADCTRASNYDHAFAKVLARVAPEALPTPAYLSSCLTLDEVRTERLVKAGQDSQFRNWVLDYLIDTLPERRRDIERHRTYVALAGIGGDRASAAIQRGLAEPESFPRMGAERAWTMLGH